MTGTIRIAFLPPDFQLNMFYHLGLLATPDVVESLMEVAAGDIQLFPVAYENDPERFYYVNLLHSFDCVDLERSGAKYNSRGRPYSVEELVIKRDRVRPHVQIFTEPLLAGVTIVRNSLKAELLRRHELCGTKVTCVL
jgi:hypothetical protein